jgi:hypothetical protein
MASRRTFLKAVCVVPALGAASRADAAASVPRWYASIPVGAWGVLPLPALGDARHRIADERPHGNDPANRAVTWPWVSSGGGQFTFKLAELPMRGGVRALKGNEGPHKLTCSDSSGDMTYRGVNDRGVFVPGTFMVWTGGGHDVWSGSEVYAVGPLERDADEGIEGLQYRRLVDPSIPPLHIQRVNLETQRVAQGGGPGRLATWDWDADGPDAGRWVAGQGLPATPFAAEDGGVGAWHSYNLTAIHPVRNVLLRTNNGDWQMGGRDNFAELDLGRNHRRTTYDARGLPASHPAGAEWHIRARDIGVLGSRDRRMFDDWLITRSATEYCNGCFWTNNNRWWAPAWRMMLRTAGDAGGPVAMVSVRANPDAFANWGRGGDSGLALVAAESRRNPAETFRLMFAYREGEVVDHTMYWVDVSEIDAPRLGRIAWASDAAGPKREDPAYSLKGGAVWDWEARCFWCFTVPVVHSGNAPWKVYTHVYRLDVPGITPGYAPGADYREAPWQSTRVDAARGGDDLYPARFYAGGTGTWKNLRFVPSPVRGLFWHGTADQRIRFFRLPPPRA